MLLAYAVRPKAGQPVLRAQRPALLGSSVWPRTAKRDE